MSKVVTHALTLPLFMSGHRPLARLGALAALTTALQACGGDGGTADPVKQATAQLDTLVPQWMARTGVPGVAVAVVHQGRTIYARGFGVRRVDDPAPVDADTVFPLASMSKSIGATVMAGQMARGASGDLGWTTPIQRLMPGFALACPDEANNARLTLGELYAHRSGLPDHAGDQLEDLGYARGEVLARLRHVRLNDPGSYAYTNFGLTAAAEAMAEARGIDWATLSEQTLYRPLGMAHTSSRYSDLAARTNRAWGHVQVGINATTYGAMPARYAVQQPPRQPDAQAPAGGASASVNDLARWMQLLLARGRWQGQQLIDASALQQAMTAWPGGGYGYGFNVGHDPHGHPTVSHSGAFLLGAHTTFILWPEANLGITVLTNAQPRGLAEAIALSFGEQALGDVPPGQASADWLQRMQDNMRSLYLPLGQLAGQQPPAQPAPAQPLSQYVGRYTNAYYGAADVVLNAAGDALELVIGPAQLRFPLRHWNGDQFVFYPGGENAPAGSVSSVQFEAQQMQIEYFAEDTTRGTFARVAATQ